MFDYDERSNTNFFTASPRKQRHFRGAKGDILPERPDELNHAQFFPMLALAMLAPGSCHPPHAKRLDCREKADRVLYAYRQPKGQSGPEMVAGHGCGGPAEAGLGEVKCIWNAPQAPRKLRM
jgi:hypothetical protein